ncbi:MAG TPA: glycoside hydrolase family 15 protein [Parvibaculum sp.]
MSSLELAVVGNCNFGALVDARGRIVWSCLPRFDGDPAFCSLLDGDEPEQGFFDIELLDFARSSQTYRRNSAILVTHLVDKHGGAVEITDFAPRFKHYGRIFRPTTLVRRVRPVAGAPRIRIRMRPRFHYGAEAPLVISGSNHIRYASPEQTLRLTTDAPVSYIVEEIPLILREEMSFFLGPDESLAASVSELAREYDERTDDYWREWTRYLALPLEWQDAVIRAAITLKLCSYEESGAVIAAMTTSVPEAAHSGRTWDYRFCWLRDAYLVVHALNRLGVSQTMEGYLGFIENVVANVADGYLQPVFNIMQGADLDERIVASLAGYRGMGPVRVGNAAYKQVQNDGYGSVILACTQTYFDQRLTRQGDRALFERLERLGEQAAQRWDVEDAGLWELRTVKRTHTYSSVLCWAACDRLARIAERLALEDRARLWRERADHIHDGIVERCWNEDLKSFVAWFDGDDVDASLLQLQQIGFISASDPRFVSTVALVEKRLRRGDYLFRYAMPDDFGVPETAFTVCTFWYIDALAAIGRVEEARSLFENILARRNGVGLLSEDVDVATGELWGNFPQTYSMVGLIRCALQLSRPWESAI